MEGFTKLPKMQCFKEGGSVQNIMKRGGKVDADDMAEDKKLIKKAFKQHDKAEHDKSPTEIKLRKGGRSKKENGSVKKYKAGGNVSEPGKKSGDLDPIKKVPVTGDKKASISVNVMPGTTRDLKGNALPDAEIIDFKGKTAPYKRGGKIKKYADGGTVMDAIGNAGTALKNNVMGTPEQNRIAQARMDMIAKKKAAEQAALLGGLGGKTALNQGAMAGQTPAGPASVANFGTPSVESLKLMGQGMGMPAPAMPMPATGPAMKRGGRTKKMNTGGTAC